jgi:hypothetical protein
MWPAISVARMYARARSSRGQATATGLRAPARASRRLPKLPAVRRLLTGALLLGALAFPAVAPASSDTGIKGVVLNTTCAGPCRYPSPPPPRYTGPGLTVKVRSLDTQELVATLHPKDGRFRVEVAPGPYRVRASVADGSSCWQGEAKRVKVVARAFTPVRLHVNNACVV